MPTPPAATFTPLNRAYQHVFRPGHLSIGLVVPLESYPHHPVPPMEHHLARARLAEQLGFSALWLRDVPFNVANFGDAGQLFDPFVYLGLLAGATDRIALGTASIVLPLRHPAHVAKAAASVDVLSGGRLLLGIASGDRPDEFPALNVPFENRGARFREGYDYLRAMADPAPTFANAAGRTHPGMDLLPKPTAPRLPLLITGGSQQSPEWIAAHGDGWMMYPRDAYTQAQLIRNWRGRLAEAGRPDQPVMQPYHIDLVADADAPATPQPIHLGHRLRDRKSIV